MAQRILVVDDDSNLLSNLKELLELNGYQVTGFQDPEQALARLKENPNHFDLILLDWKLQAALDGDTIIKMLKYRYQNNFKTPVICMSAHTAISSKHFIRLGAFDTIRKPFSGDELLEKIARALNKKPPEDPNQHAPSSLSPEVYEKNYMARKIISALAPNKSIGEVARELGCSRSSVYRWLQKLRIREFLDVKEP